MVLGILALYTWATVHYGGRNFNSPYACHDRRSHRSFEGLSDFYGLGIRIGLYLQWLCVVLASAFTPSDARIMTGTYLGSSFAFIIAMLLLIFQEDCAFTAEMIVLLDILWGGYLAVFLPIASYMASLASEKKALGLQTIIAINIYLLITPSAWFCIRTASAGEVDFAPTPGGANFFLLAHITPHNFQIASKFMAFLIVWIAYGVLLNLLLLLLQPLPRIQHILSLLGLMSAETILASIATLHALLFAIIAKLLTYCLRRLPPRSTLLAM
jgi:hypothetical protein